MKERLATKRARTPHSLQLTLPSSKKFELERGESIATTIWSEFENIVLMEIFRKGQS